MFDQMFSDGGWIEAEINSELADEVEPPAEPPTAPTEIELEDSEFEGEMAVPMVGMAGMMGGMEFSDFFDLTQSIPTGGLVEEKIEKEKIWKKAVKNVLTKEQSEKYKAVVEQRMNNRIEAVTNGFIGRVDRSLLLSEEQKKEMFELVKDKYGKKLLTAKDNQFSGFFMPDGGMAKEVEESPFTELLTPPQKKIWNATYRKELESLSSMQNSVRFGGGIF